MLSYERTFIDVKRSLSDLLDNAVCSGYMLSILLHSSIQSSSVIDTSNFSQSNDRSKKLAQPSSEENNFFLDKCIDSFSKQIFVLMKLKVIFLGLKG